MNARYEYHPENGDHSHVCVWDHADGSALWFACLTQDHAEAKVAEMRARFA